MMRLDVQQLAARSCSLSLPAVSLRSFSSSCSSSPCSPAVRRLFSSSSNPKTRVSSSSSCAQPAQPAPSPCSSHASPQNLGGCGSGVTISATTGRQRLPPWLKREVGGGELYNSMKRSLKELKLNTVCTEAKCPQIAKCWGGGGSGVSTATIMLMGDTCTRACRFCSIKKSTCPPPLDTDEPRRVAEAVGRWGLGYVVLTSVDRDDLADGGAEHIAQTIRLLKKKNPRILVEALVPDFQGNDESISKVARSGLEVFAHNLETVERLQNIVRDRRTSFNQSLHVLRHAKETRPSLITKTSFMVGVGETEEELMHAMRAAREAGVECLTIGQYLRPDKFRMKVHKFWEPAAFERWRKEGEQMGFLYVASGPMVRSSYRAGELFIKNKLMDRQKERVEREQAEKKQALGAVETA